MYPWYQTAIFKTENLTSLLRNKYVILIGDSVQRSVYKDFVVLSHENRFMAQSELRKKGEESFLDDTLVERSELTNGTNYREVREYRSDDLHLKFFFITRIFNSYVESILSEMKDPNTPDPDVLILNSCLWDISRYGQNSMELYKKNLKKFCGKLVDILPKHTLVVWRTTLPVSEEMKGGFMTSDAEWCRNTLQLNVMRANYFAMNILSDFRFDVLDMHTHFRGQLHRQARDGVHWNMYAHRRMTNLLLTHIAAAWNQEAPEFPWADDSTIEFSPDEVEMNTTNVLMRAYQPNLRSKTLLPTPTDMAGLLKPPPSLRSIVIVPPATHRRRSIEEERYGGPIRSTHEMYSGYYDIPQEEPDYDENGNYWILPEQPLQQDINLPTEPYPQYSAQWDNAIDYTADPTAYWNSCTTSGPVRHAKKWSSRRQARRPGKASQMIQKRMKAEQAERRRINVNIHSKENFHSFQTSTRRAQWSAYSRHNPRYDPYTSINCQ